MESKIKVMLFTAAMYLQFYTSVYLLWRTNININIKVVNIPIFFQGNKDK